MNTLTDEALMRSYCAGDHGDLEHPALPDPPRQRRLSEAIARLAPSQRTALLLRRVDGLPFAEVAVRCGATETAVKLRAHRGSERLRRELAGL
jgi:DNA-directed RNA polymerase specialized sigma24 family protein